MPNSLRIIPLTHGRVLLTIISLAFGFGIVGQARAQCEVWEVIEMIDDGEDRSDVRDACKNQVSDAPSCSLSKVYRLYDREYLDEEEILAECGGDAIGAGVDGGTGGGQRYATFCQMPYGACALPPGGPIGVVCNCSGVVGTSQ